MHASFRVIFVILAFAFSITLWYAGDGYIVETSGKVDRQELRKKIIENVLDTNVMKFWYRALSIFIDANQFEPRGKMQGRSITLSAHVLRDGEFLKLFIHELWHYIDIYTLVPWRVSSDPSDRFYTISWQDKTTKKSGETLASFISGYAATNKYEDFAESFVFYVFHNQDFADRAMKNDSLRKKYLFFSQYVFRSGEFMDTDFRIGKMPSYLWDTTKIPISVQKYLYSLR